MDETAFLEFVKFVLLAKRRKTLVNNLKSQGEKRSLFERFLTELKLRLDAAR